MDIELYSTVEYTPGWYYHHFPGFWNVECYRILSDYSFHPEKYVKDVMEEDEEEATTDEDEENKNRKRKRKNIKEEEEEERQELKEIVLLEDVVCSEQR